MRETYGLEPRDEVTPETPEAPKTDLPPSPLTAATDDCVGEARLPWFVLPMLALAYLPGRVAPWAPLALGPSNGPFLWLLVAWGAAVACVSAACLLVADYLLLGMANRCWRWSIGLLIGEQVSYASLLMVGIQHTPDSVPTLALLGIMLGLGAFAMGEALAAASCSPGRGWRMVGISLAIGVPLHGGAYCLWGWGCGGVEWMDPTNLRAALVLTVVFLIGRAVALAYALRQAEAGAD